MSRKVFTSFHYQPDNWRASQVRNIGKIEGNSIVSANKWEEVTNGGDSAIRNWIDTNMSGKSCVIVLVGSGTAGRKWIKYEIEKAWNDGRGIFGVYIHKLKDVYGDQSFKGSNPFADFSVGSVNMSSIVKCYDPPFMMSTYVYSHIKNNIENWIEEAVRIRGTY